MSSLIRFCLPKHSSASGRNKQPATQSLTDCQRKTFDYTYLSFGNATQSSHLAHVFPLFESRGAFTQDDPRWEIRLTDSKGKRGTAMNREMSLASIGWVPMGALLTCANLQSQDFCKNEFFGRKRKLFKTVRTHRFNSMEA